MRFLLVLLTTTALPAFAATPRECHLFLRNNPVRLQCGDTCVTHTLLGMLEMHLQTRLSIEYALLANAAQTARSVQLPNVSPGVRAWISALLALGHSGVQSEEEFLNPVNRKWFESYYHRSLNEVGILNLRPHLTRLDIDPWWLGHESDGRKRWRETARKFRFEFLSSDHLAHLQMATFQSQLRAMGLDIHFGYAMKEEIEIEVDHALNVGYPTAVILEPRLNERHSEIALHRMRDGAMVSRNTAKVAHWWFWERPAPRMERPAHTFSQQLSGALLIWEN